MNKTISTTLTVIAILAIAGVIFFAGTMYARANAFGPSMMGGNGGMMTNGGNMMKGYRYNNTNLTPLTFDQAKAAAEKISGEAQQFSFTNRRNHDLRQ